MDTFLSTKSNHSLETYCVDGVIKQANKFNDLHSFTLHMIFENLLSQIAPDFKKYLHLPSETQNISHVL